MKNITTILLIILIGAGMLAAAEMQYTAYMPLVQDDSADPTATPEPTHTNTPRPPTPTPTVTPFPVWDDSGNTCVHIDGAIKDKISGNIIVGGVVPSVCSYMVVHDEQQDDSLVILKAIKIKTDTWGCEEGDFGYWPPIDFPCPPPDEPISEWGQILWGDYDVIKIADSAQTVCGYCEECGPPYTSNCVEVSK